MEVAIESYNALRVVRSEQTRGGAVQEGGKRDTQSRAKSSSCLGQD
jgi:hypothetical protein